MYWSSDVERFEAGILLTNPSSKINLAYQKIIHNYDFIKGVNNFLEILNEENWSIY